MCMCVCVCVFIPFVCICMHVCGGAKFALDQRLKW